MTNDDENITQQPWPWTILDTAGNPVATGESFVVPGIMALPGGGRAAVVSTDQGVNIINLYRKPQENGPS